MGVFVLDIKAAVPFSGTAAFFIGFKLVVKLIFGERGL
jgi:hypothetical protein